MRLVGPFVAMLFVPLIPAGAEALAMPPQIESHPAAREATVYERPGVALPLEVPLVLSDGERVRFGHFFQRGRPVLIVPGYHECDMLCPLVLEGFRSALEERPGWRVGEDLVVVAVSIDPREGPAEARDRRTRLGAGAGWHFATADSASLSRIMEAIGFRYAFDDRSGRFAHVAVAVAATPDGRVGRYVYGLDPAPDDLGSALASARDGRAAASLERILVRCFRFLPALQQYAGAIAWFLRVGGLAIVAGLAGVFVLAGRRAVTEAGE